MFIYWMNCPGKWSMDSRSLVELALLILVFILVAVAVAAAAVDIRSHTLPFPRSPTY